MYKPQWILFNRGLISVRLNPDDDPENDSNQLCSLSAQLTVYNLSEIKSLDE